MPDTPPGRRRYHPGVRSLLRAVLLSSGLVGLFGCQGGIELAASPTVRAFPDTELGQATSAVIQVDLVRGARADFEAHLEPAGVAAFRLEPGFLPVLQPGQPEMLTVYFAPDLPRQEVALLVVEASNVQGVARFEVTLTGRGLSTPVDGDRDGAPSSEDCDDFDPSVWPGAPELCDGLDTDCDGVVPADELDADADGVLACAGDCDDLDPTVAPGAPELCDDLDNDCDGQAEAPDGDGDGVKTCEGDCDDVDPAVFPNAVEQCDGRDDDCDGVVPADELDADADGVPACAGDCDDGAPSVLPGAPELCDGVDTDCDGDVPSVEVDGDGDGVSPCAGDCDDGDSSVLPGAPELCDGLDTDCDLALALSELDGDGDGFLGCEECDDLSAGVFPGAPELCDGVDTDCDGVVPAGEVDVDGDGFRACAECDDGQASVYPGAPELCDGLDNDCADGVPSDEVDLDWDGVLACAECDDGDAAVFPGAPEICDGLDDDCDGVVPADEVDDDGDGAIECDGGDCDDADPDAFVGNVEGCFDTLDNDCDGVVNQGCACPVWADPLAPPGCATPGTYACPHPTVQAAVDAAASSGVCSAVWLQPGTYAERIDLDEDLEMVGVLGAAATVLDAGGLGRAITIADDRTVQITGITVRGGQAQNGGGLLADGAALSLLDVVFDDNACDAGSNGGALRCVDCALTVSGATFSDNTCGFGGASAGNNGGAMSLVGGTVSVVESVFVGNTAGDGGAVFLTTDGANHAFVHNTFQNNDADDSQGGFGEMDGGGAMFVNGDRVYVIGNLFLGNTSAYGGASAVHVNSPGGSTVIANNVMVLNSSSDGTVYFEYTWGSNPALVYGNIVSQNFGAAIYSEDSWPPQVQYNDLWSNTGGSFDTDAFITPSVPPNNLSADPLFVALSNDGDVGNDDYALGVGSPCIDAGHPGADWNDVDGSRNDMGLFGGPLGSWAGP